MKYAVLPVLMLCLSACGLRTPAPLPPQVAAIEQEGPIRPKVRPPGLGRNVPKNATTAEQFDVTTAEERRDAAAAPVAAERKLGSTIASLGDPTQAGFWIKTPLVDAQSKGRVVYPPNGKSAQVDLIPIEGAASAGSRMSISTFQLLSAPLTGLPEVDVYQSATGGS